MSENKFEWDKELIDEFAEYLKKYCGLVNPSIFDLDNTLRQFKLEKLMKQNWVALSIDTNHRITEVKRLDDGQIFKIGDLVKCTEKGQAYPIHSLSIKGYDCYVSTDGFGMHLQYIYKAEPKVLFTTEDGFDITDPEQFLYYVGDFKVRSRKAANMVHLDNKKFYSEAAAWEYILMNKPLLSVKDICGLWTLSGDVREQLKDLAKQKLGK